MLLSLGTWLLADPGRRWRGPGTPGAGADSLWRISTRNH